MNIFRKTRIAATAAADKPSFARTTGARLTAVVLTATLAVPTVMAAAAPAGARTAAAARAGQQPLTAATPPTPAPAYIYADCHNRVTMPTQIVFGCARELFRIQDIHWDLWNYQFAAGEGLQTWTDENGAQVMPVSFIVHSIVGDHFLVMEIHASGVTPDINGTLPLPTPDGN